jgi:hypothetical protein
MTKSSTFTVPPSPTGIYTIPIGVGGSGGTFAAVGGTGGSGMVKSRMVVDHEITGQTITASYQVSHAEMLNSASTLEDVKYGIKKILIGKIAEKLFESSMIEFTQQEQVTEDAVMFRARIHVTPDTQVRVIRELKDAGKTT